MATFLGERMFCGYNWKEREGHSKIYLQSISKRKKLNEITFKKSYFVTASFIFYKYSNTSSNDSIVVT